MSARYLLDTCTLSYFFRGNQNVIKHMQEKLPGQLYLSAITIHEIEYGLMLKEQKSRELRSKWNAMLELFNIVNFDQNAALQAAKIRSSLKRSGKPIGAYDLLIGASCLAEELICVTSNTAEFSRIKDLQLEDWNK